MVDSIEDFVGYGSAGFAEGASAPELTNTTAAFRRSGGCIDTNNNRDDFTTGSPSPRNGGSTPAPCVALGPLISAAGVTNAASYASGTVAPGEMVTIFGSGLGPPSLLGLQTTSDRQYLTKELGGTRVLFNGIAAPMIYTVSGQVSAVVPYSVSAGATTELQVEYNGQISNRVSLAVEQAAPGLFTVDASGHGQAAVLNQDYSANGCANGAQRGSVLMIYATGAGQTIPAGEDGRITAPNPPQQAHAVSVTIGGQEAGYYTQAAHPEW